MNCPQCEILMEQVGDAFLCFECDEIIPVPEDNDTQAHVARVSGESEKEVQDRLEKEIKAGRITK